MKILERNRSNLYVLEDGDKWWEAHPKLNLPQLACQFIVFLNFFPTSQVQPQTKFNTKPCALRL